MEKVENDKAKDAILEKYNKMKGEWKTLIQNEMDPRRIWLGKFTRYNIHQKEFHEWALRPVLNYEKIYERAAELG